MRDGGAGGIGRAGDGGGAPLPHPHEPCEWLGSYGGGCGVDSLGVRCSWGQLNEDQLNAIHERDPAIFCEAANDYAAAAAHDAGAAGQGGGAGERGICSSWVDPEPQFSGPSCSPYAEQKVGTCLVRGECCVVVEIFSCAP